ncbi:hypothetical protein ACSBR1_009022 [Camellia fascicularis]
MENPHNPQEPIDELAMAKAAAWAWYQRGSGSEGKPMSEYHFTRTHRPPKPPRYNLEAMKTPQPQAIEESLQKLSPLLLSPHRTHIDDNSDLLDRYEIERISKHLDYYIEISNVKHNTGFRGGGRRVALLPESETSSGMNKNNKEKSKKAKGFWLRHRMVTCGSRDDVVEFAKGFRERQWPLKR